MLSENEALTLILTLDLEISPPEPPRFTEDKTLIRFKNEHYVWT